MKECKSCGIDYEDVMKFCTKCGKPLEEKKQGKECPECGTENPEGARFCSNCRFSFAAKPYVCTNPDCGARYAKPVKFCNECGKEVAMEDALDESEDDEDEEISPDMVFVEGGWMRLGSYTDKCNPIYDVELDSFYISKYQVTQKLWNSVMSYDNSKHIGKNRPVNSESWYDAVVFCNKLSEKEGLNPCYRIDKHRKDPNNKNEDKDDGLKWTVICNWTANGYRLPTMAEWEYAARGGRKSRGYEYAGSDDIDEVAWYKDNSNNETHDVGEKKPNELGLYDMCGNVEEWCWDWQRSIVAGGKNPTGPEFGTMRSCHGHCFFGTKKCCTVSHIGTASPESKFLWIGFRLARSCK